jgi:predicted dehydrogenase
MKKVRWGIVGAGRISRQFCTDMHFTANSEVIAVASRDIDRANAFAAHYDIARAYGNYQALFADSDVEAVYIATPHNCHFPQAREALLAGKHVLVEKPIAISSRQCRELGAIAREQQLFLMEAMWTWFLPAVRKALHWAQAGRIGNIQHIKADFGYPIPYSEDQREYDARLNGGCLLEMGIYPLALAFLFLGRLPEKTAVFHHLAANGVEDDVTLLARYGEQTASLATSFRAKLPNMAFIIGDQGQIQIPDFWRAESCRLLHLDTEVDAFHDRRRGQGFEFQIEAAGHGILNGEMESAIMPLEASFKLQQQMEQLLARIHRSSN